MTSGTSGWITLLAGLGIGSVVAALVSWWSTKAVTISNHRQNWINALRDDLVTYLREIEVVHYRNARLSGARGEPTTEDLQALQEARNAALFVYRRILLRLNMTEPLHVRLGELLKGLLRVQNTTADSQHIDEVIALARQVLKHEWAVTKYGMFTTPVVAFKKMILGQ
jgi:hypothetical protein